MSARTRLSRRLNAFSFLKVYHSARFKTDFDLAVVVLVSEFMEKAD
jgi:hypothetical protein